MNNMTVPKAVENFLTASNAHELEAWNGVFADGASVRDDGKTWVGEAEIRDWIQVHLIDPKVVTTPTSFEGNRLVASGDGDFPGGPLSFAFVFDIKDDQIVDLVIDPA